MICVTFGQGQGSNNLLLLNASPPKPYALDVAYSIFAGAHVTCL